MDLENMQEWETFRLAQLFGLSLARSTQTAVMLTSRLWFSYTVVIYPLHAMAASAISPRAEASH